jgi:hypothetical protein
MDNEVPRYWLGEAPIDCQTCPEKIDDCFYDAKTDYGPWAFMCPACFHLGPGLSRVGVGLGQEYTKQEDGRWLKTGG